MPDIVLHEVTRVALDRFIAQPVHALLLIGPEGSGKSVLADHIAASLLKLAVSDLDSYPYLHKVRSNDGKALGIEEIRGLQQLLTLKIPVAKSGITRILIIEDAHTLTTEAQNALLKTLEEPPVNTVLVLAAASAEAMLPTILSRVRSLHILPPAEQDIRSHFTAAGHAEADISRAVMLSGGLPGLMHALLTDAAGHPLYEATNQARELLQASAYDRLALVDALSKQKDLCSRILFILGQMAHTALQKADSMPAASRQRWQTILRLSYVTKRRVDHNSQMKLVLTDLMLNL